MTRTLSDAEGYEVPVTEKSLLPERSREDRVMNGVSRYPDIEALAFSIVHALEDRDSGLVAEVDALRRQVAALTTVTDRAMSPTLDVTALEAVIERQPELRRELNGVVEHLLDSARSGRPAAPTTTALMLLTLPLTQSLTRRHNEIEREIQSLRGDVASLCEEVANLSLILSQEHRRSETSPVDVDIIRKALRVELGPLRQQVAALDRAGELAALRDQVTELGERLTSAQPAGQSVLLQDAIRGDLARLIERLNAQSRTDQVVALREEVRAQLGTLDQAEELRNLRLMIATELSLLRQQAQVSVSANRTANGSAGLTNSDDGSPNGSASVHHVRSTDSADRRNSRRGRSGTANVQRLLRALRQRSDDLEGKMAGLRQRGKQRAMLKTGDPHVVVSGPAALLLGVADLLEEHDAP